MSDVVLILGPLAFQDFEVASAVAFGGEQRIAVHDLPGGGRVIDALGRAETEITFSGIFTGPDATLRARTLDELRASGAVLPLTWDVFFYSVVVSRFAAEYQNGGWVPYRATCTVLRDEAGALIDTALSLAGGVLADLAGAAFAAAGLADLSTAQAATAAPGFATRGAAAYDAARAGLAGADLSLAAAAAGPESSVVGLGGALFGTGGPAGVVAAIGAAADASGALGQLALARAFAGRAAVNLANAST
jgi:hypothetical protein